MPGKDVGNGSMIISSKLQHQSKLLIPGDLFTEDALLT